jgi:hypothetical protein
VTRSWSWSWSRPDLVCLDIDCRWEGEEDDVSRFGFGFGGTSRILILVPQILRSKWDRDQDLGPREECYQEMLSLAGQGQGMTGQQGARGSLSSPFRLGCPSSAGPALPATVADAAVLDGPRAVPGWWCWWWWWCWCWKMQRGGVRPVEGQWGHRMGESRYWRTRCSHCTECMELLDLDEKVHRQLATAIVASPATRSTPRWSHRPCIGCLRRQAPTNSAFPAWDRLLGMNGWGDLWGQGARACLASRCPVKSVRTIFTESGSMRRDGSRILQPVTGRGTSCWQGDGWPQTNLSRGTVTGIPSRP